MSKNNDPRNMFVDNRQGYTQQDEPSGSPTATPQEDTASSSGGTQNKSYDERVEEMKRLASISVRAKDNLSGILSTT